MTRRFTDGGRTDRKDSMTHKHLTATCERFNDHGSTAYHVVLPDGDVIGTITRAWFRVGGWGWTYNGLGGLATIASAARQCEHRYWKSLSKQADASKACE